MRLCCTVSACCCVAAVIAVAVYWSNLPDCARRTGGKVDGSRGNGHHYWPSSIGHVGSYGTSRHNGPSNLSQALAWSYQHPLGRFHTPGLGGTVLDDKLNVYLSSNYEIIKFSPDGRVLWTFYPAGHCTDLPQDHDNLIMNSPSLWGNAIFGSTERGTTFAVDIETGKEIWSTQRGLLGCKTAPGTGINNGFVQVHEGVVVVDTLFSVQGLNATDGALMWDFTPDNPVWNFLAAFVDDGTFVFQDWSGRAYRCSLTTGRVLWKAGGYPGSWTDGSISLSDGLVYAVNNYMGMGGTPPSRNYVGRLTAYDLATGELRWEHQLPKSPNNFPAVGRLGPGKQLSIVQPIGIQDVQWERYNVWALDAKTGELQWTFMGPQQVGPRQATADLTPLEQQRVRPTCVPNPWSAPTIDAAGTVYIASQEGGIYALRDANGDGTVDGEEEVSSYETNRGFCGSEAPSLGPGIMAIASCDKLFVFRWPLKPDVA